MNEYCASPGRVTLLDGPGEGQKFRVARAPIFMRFVSTPEGHWDVLDQLEDTPRVNEEVHVYLQLSWMHVRGQKREDSGIYYDYAHVMVDGPAKAELRYNNRWQVWAKDATAKLEQIKRKQKQSRPA